MSARRRLWRDVAESIRSQPGRIGLSFLAVTTGIVVLTLLLAMLQGLRAEARRMISLFGADVIAAAPEAAVVQRGGWRGFARWCDHLSANLAPGSSAAMIGIGATVEGSGIPVWAAGADLVRLRGWTVVEGRLFDALDEARGARVALVTEAVRQRGGPGVGGEVRIGGHAFAVIGVLREGGGIPDGALRATDGGPVALIPVAAAAQLNLPIQPATAALFLRAASAAEPEQVIASIEALCSDPAWSDWTFAWITPDTLLRGVRAWQRVVGVAAGSIALLCLLLGGTTLMSLMLADVRQRIPEIGLRRSLGATRRDIAVLFVAESMAVTGAAAVAGTLLAGVLLAAVTGHAPVPLAIDHFTFVIPVFVSIVIGGVFSFWPARLAAGMSPAQALRNA